MTPRMTGEHLMYIFEFRVAISCINLFQPSVLTLKQTLAQSARLKYSV